MRVEKLELNGFKSFTDSTVFNFHPGITCVVGPNGCGKSNVVDAFKWVLGEQSAKSLRGDKMEEVIFNGSQTKKPKGMAEVGLTVSGLGNPENGGDGLTTVSRRLYRSGESEYIINKDICRMRDIRDIFLDTGLELKSYSIIEQDRIAAVISAKPEERRFLIEEVAGVVKYKVRRAEAMSKLESSRLNLQRINDIIAEVKRQINSLDRQVKKAERYKRLMEELRSIELRLAKRDYLELRAALDAATRQYEALKEEDAVLRGELGKSEADIEVKKIALVEKEKRLMVLQSGLHETEREIAALERETAVLKTDAENLRQYLMRLGLDEEAAVKGLAGASGMRLELEAAKKDLQAEGESLKEELRLKNDSLGIKEDELSKMEELLESKKKEAFKASEDLSLLKNELSVQASFFENLQRRTLKTGAEYNETSEGLKGLDFAIGDAGARAADKELERDELTSRKDSIIGQVTGDRERLDALRSELTTAREELAACASRLESMKEMIAGGMPVGEIKSVARISEVLDVPAEYEKAVEAALREAIDGFILQRGDIENAVKAIMEKDAEKTALIPLEGTPMSAGAPEGAIGMAMDGVKAPEKFLHVLKTLLGNTALVKDLKTALGMDAPGMTLVTLDGIVVEPSGAVLAGKGKGVLRVKRQVKELDAELQNRNTAIAGIQAGMDALLDEIALREESLRETDSGLSDIEKELDALALERQGLSQEAGQSQRKLSYLELELDEIAKEKESLRKVIEQREAALKGADKKKALADEAVIALQRLLSEDRAFYEKQREQTVDIRLRLNSAREKTDSLEKELAGLEGLTAGLLEKRRFIEGELAQTESKLKEKEDLLKEKEGFLGGLVLKAGGLQGEISLRREEVSGETDGLNALELALKGLRAKSEPLLRRLSELEVARAEHKLRLENLQGRIRDNYQIALDAAEVEPPSEEDPGRLDEVKKKIEELGPVSLGSLQEHEELRTRYEFLTKQHSDIEQSIAELEEAISRINATTKKRLREAFDALNAKSSETYAMLFGGGRAELRLTDESNILETGIEVVVQPPGKRLQNINLLSGGEKALTALSLLFSGFLIKPTPLCILDEADAALDESNTGKFSKMVKELSRGVQFIVITHQRTTMETADYIYGITMEEPGVSKVISVEFASA